MTLPLAGLFSSERIAISPEVQLLRIDLPALLRRHLAGDWGFVSGQQRRANEAGILTQGRLISIFQTTAGEVWFITEPGHTFTCCLTPAEYARYYGPE
ncbi:MAG: hypothetical protein RMK99_00470 [Anaerolineales bacterium]|nr:hypothetical protein [Anaerolineales bacterium]